MSVMPPVAEWETQRKRPVVIAVASVLFVVGIFIPLFALAPSLSAEDGLPSGRMLGLIIGAAVGVGIGVGVALRWRAKGPAMDRTMAVALPTLGVSLYFGFYPALIFNLAPLVVALYVALGVVCAYGLDAGKRVGWIGAIVFSSVNALSLLTGIRALVDITSTGTWREFVGKVLSICCALLFPAVILLVTVPASARRYIAGEPATSAMVVEQQEKNAGTTLGGIAGEPATSAMVVEQQEDDAGTTLGVLAVVFALAGFLAWIAFLLAFFTAFRLYGSMTAAEQARFSFFRLVGYALAIGGPGGAVVLGSLAQQRGDERSNAGRLGHIAKVICVTQLPILVGLIILTVVIG